MTKFTSRFMITSSNENIFRVTGPLCSRKPRGCPVLQRKGRIATLDGTAYKCALWAPGNHNEGMYISAAFLQMIFKLYFLYENCCILVTISLYFVPMCRLNNNPVLVQIMARRGRGDKPLSETTMVFFRDAYMRRWDITSSAISVLTQGPNMVPTRPADFASFSLFAGKILAIYLLHGWWFEIMANTWRVNRNLWYNHPLPWNTTFHHLLAHIIFCLSALMPVASHCTNYHRKQLSRSGWIMLKNTPLDDCPESPLWEQSVWELALESIWYGVNFHPFVKQSVLWHSCVFVHHFWRHSCAFCQQTLTQIWVWISNFISGFIWDAILTAVKPNRRWGWS